MTISKRKQPFIPAVPAASAPPISDYESGYFDCLKMVQTIINDMEEQFRPAVMNGTNNPAAFMLSAAASASQNLLGAVHSEMEKRTVRTLQARRASTSRGSER